MRRFLACLLIAITAVSLSYAVYYVFNDTEVISVSANTMYKEVGDKFDIDLDVKNKKFYTTVDITSSNDKVVEVEDNGELYYAKSGGVSRINFRTSNVKFRNLYCDVLVGDGTKEAPFYITSAEQLASIGRPMLDENGNYTIRYGLNQCYKLVSDVDVSQINGGYWCPLGEFSGLFDGNGYRIIGINIDMMSYLTANVGSQFEANFTNSGLFTKIAPTGKVYNLKLSRFTARGDGYTTIGTIAGVNNGTIERIEVSDAFFDVSADYVGGIAGQNITTEDLNDGYSRTTARIDRCAVHMVLGKTATIVDDQITYTIKGMNGVIGGLTGLNYGGLIIYSYTIGEVYLGGTDIVYGGIVGENTYGSFTASGSVFTNVQGAYVKDCYSAISLYVGKVKNLSNEEIGGLIGINNDYVFDDEGGEIIYYNKLIGDYYDINKLNIGESDVPIKSFDGVGKYYSNKNLVKIEVNREEKIYYIYGYNTARMVNNENYDVTVNYFSHTRNEAVYNTNGAYLDSKEVIVMWKFGDVWLIDGQTNEGYPYLNYEYVLLADEFDDDKIVYVDSYTISINQRLYASGLDSSTYAKITVYDTTNNVVKSSSSTINLDIYYGYAIYKTVNNDIEIYDFNGALAYTIKFEILNIQYSFKNWSCGTNTGWTYVICDGDKSITLWLGETEKMFSVFFNYNGATANNEITSKVVTLGDRYGMLPTPAKQGFIFRGWYLDTNFTKMITDNSFVITDSSHTLYASWLVMTGGTATETYQIIFNKVDDNATGIMNNQTMHIGETSNLLKNSFKLSGYTFGGWALTPNGYKVYSDGQSVTNLTSTPYGTINLYAIWSKNSESYKIVFYKNNSSATGSMGSQSMALNTWAAINKNTFVLPGYKFIGWATTSNGSAIYEDCMIVNNLSTIVGGTVYLYAVWEEVVTIIVFDKNNDSANGIMPNQILHYGETANLIANNYKLSGYTFKYWSSPNYPTINLLDDEDIVYYVNSNDDITITLFAVWEKNEVVSATYTIVFNKNSTTATGTMSNQIMTCGKSANLKNNAYINSGYTFKGWATTIATAVKYADGQSVTNLSSVNGTKVNLFAVWEKNEVVSATYTIVFNKNSTTATGTMSNQTMTCGKSANLKKNIYTKNGYAFKGWSKSIAGSVNYTDGQSVINLSSVNGAKVNLYAVWEEVVTIIVFDKNNDSATGTMPNQILHYGETTNLIANNYKLSGYTFKYWSSPNYPTVNLLDDEDIVYYVNSTDGITITLYAVWEKNEVATATYTIVYNKNSTTATGTMNNQTMTCGGIARLYLNEFTRAGYEFKGWATSNKVDAPIRFTNGEKIIHNLTAVNGKTIMLYAVWEKNEVATYTIIYNSNSTTATGAMSNQTMTCGEIARLYINKFTRAGYEFKGWSTSSKENSSIRFTDNEKITYDLTAVNGKSINLYAVWEAIQYTIIYNSNSPTAKGEMSEQIMTFDQIANLNNNEFTNEGHSFKCWSTTPTGGNDEFNFLNGQSITSSLSSKNGGVVYLFAIWS